MKLPSQRIVEDNSQAARAFQVFAKNKNGGVLAIDALDAFTVQLLNGYQNLIQGLWISSLGSSARAGLEDVYNLSPRDYSELICDINLVKKKQLIIVDADNGGQNYKNTRYAFELYAQLGVHMGIVENKRGLKYNSVDDTATKLHEIEDNSVFGAKINAAMLQNTTLVAARIENGILNEENPELAIDESLAVVDYLYQNARPDMYVFHWKGDNPQTPIKFAKMYYEKYHNDDNRPLLGCIPTTYSKNIENKKLFKCGYSLIIYGNVLLRTQMKSIHETILSIDKLDSLRELDKSLPNLKNLFDVVYK
jgi:2-methylisocitrate lyase-like PEP mutase family enzyme